MGRSSVGSQGRVSLRRSAGCFRVSFPTVVLTGLYGSAPFAVDDTPIYGVDANSRRLEDRLVHVYVYAGSVSYLDGGIAVVELP